MGRLNAEEGGIAAWLYERNAETGDTLAYAYMGNPKDVRFAIVLSSGYGYFDVCPYGSCFYEDMRRHVPLELTRCKPPEFSATRMKSASELVAEQVQPQLRRVK